ncbi:MAG: DUF393 domain-containing protein [Planctomycetaceae bacterium]|nr:DUF393 domain-containing protein [Planctomycetaceae bacterium]
MSANSDSKLSHVVFFDGICGFCNRSVNFLMGIDRHNRLRFAPLQGSTASQCLPAELQQNLDTLVFLTEGRLYVRSAAVVRILCVIGGVWRVAGILLWLIPLPIRDACYRLVSRIRYRVFGKHETCRLPKPEERGLVLD